MRFEGGCHRGDLRVVYESEIPPERTAVRLCQCSFCRRHGARAATDPAGRLDITIAPGARPSRYVFGLRTAGLLLCARYDGEGPDRRIARRRERWTPATVRGG